MMTAPFLRMRLHLLVALAIAAMTGCAPEVEQPAATAPPLLETKPSTEAPVAAEAPPDASDVRARADLIVRRLVGGINGGRPEVLAQISAIPPERPELASARAALADFQRYFGQAQVARYERRAETGNEPRLGRDGTWSYGLIGENGSAKEVRVYYDARLDTLRVFDEFLRYSGRVHRYVNEVVDALNEGDAAELALLLSVDDLDYPVSLAERAIRNYGERFDLGTLDVSFMGLDPPRATPADRPFLFSIRGQKDGAAISHSVRVVMGDGLLGWDDTLIPLYQGV